MKYNLSIDPGSKSIGISVWNAENWDKLTAPEYSLEVSSDADSWDARIASITEMLGEAQGLFDLHSYVTTAYIELPTYREDRKGKKAARTDSVVKLSIAAGAIAQVCIALEAKVVWVPIIKWKGNLSKDQTKKRVVKRLGEIELVSYSIRYDDTGLVQEGYGKLKSAIPTDDLWDSVALGLWAKGMF